MQEDCQNLLAFKNITSRILELSRLHMQESLSALGKWSYFLSRHVLAILHEHLSFRRSGKLRIMYSNETVYFTALNFPEILSWNIARILEQNPYSLEQCHRIFCKQKWSETPSEGFSSSSSKVFLSIRLEEWSITESKERMLHAKLLHSLCESPTKYYKAAQSAKKNVGSSE